MTPQEKLNRLRNKKIIDISFKIGKVGAVLKITLEDKTQLTFGASSGMFQDRSTWENRAIIAIDKDKIYESVVAIKNPQ